MTQKELLSALRKKANKCDKDMFYYASNGMESEVQFTLGELSMIKEIMELVGDPK